MSDNEKTVSEKEDRREKISSLITYSISIFLATAACVWYYMEHPPDTPARQREKLFYKQNASKVMKFIKMPRQKQREFATQQRHPFYVKYYEASEVEKEEINARIHLSVDYSPNQYWFNLVFQWTIWFTLVLFIGKMTEGVLIMMRANAPVPRNKGPS